MNLFAIAIGGAIGALLRYGVSLWLTFPFGTLSANIIGAMAMGIAYGIFETRISTASLFIMVGILGSFTTFSSFSLDVLRLLEAGRTALAGGIVLGHILGSLAAVAIGFLVTRMVLV